MPPSSHIRSSLIRRHLDPPFPYQMHFDLIRMDQLASDGRLGVERHVGSPAGAGWQRGETGGEEIEREKMGLDGVVVWSEGEAEGLVHSGPGRVWLSLALMDE